MPTTKKRKLRAILFADIVGYTSFMQKDEAHASILLQKFRNTLNEKVTQHSGEVINNYGDGCLCTFESAVDAMTCAKEVQTVFQKEPIVPVRIGLHSGDVFFEDDNVFGDSVNIASRIESLGVSGAILFSKRIKRHISNQKEFEAQSLGEFDFKNVEKTMEVFALANKGFAIPKREDMKGKLKSKKSSNRLIYALLGLLIIAFAGFWFLKKDNGMQLGEEFPNSSTPLSKEIRQKRVAVLVFENKTGSENLEDFGTMISDWITKGLMETGEANVISAANIQSQIKLAGVATPKFAKSTGVGVILQGRYYLQEDQLIIHANIVDTEKGEVIHALDHIQGHRNNMLDLLDEMTQKVLGYWAVKNQKRYLQNPPNYRAYQKFMAADKIFANFDQFEKTERLLQEAYQLDTTFYAPLLKLAVLYENTRGMGFRKDSLVLFIENLDPQFTQYEKLRLDYINAGEKNQHLKAAQINEQIYRMDNSNGGANTNASFLYLRANMPQKALEIINEMDPRFLDLTADFSWREIRRTQAHFELGNYDKVITVAEAYAFPKLMSDIAGLHLRALVQLDSMEGVKQAYQKYVNKGFYAFNGKEREAIVLLDRICSEAYLCNKNEILNKFIPLYINWTKENKDSSHRHFKSNMGFAAFLQSDIKEALSIWEKQKIDPERKWNYANKRSQVGVCHAMLGNIEKAEEQLAILDSKVLYDDWPIDKYFKARIQAALGRFDEAVQNIEFVVEKGIFLMHSERGKADVFLKPLHGYPAFEELVKPKG